MFRTILVHLADDQAHTQRIDLACDMAKVYQSHLLMVYCTSPASMPAAIEGRGASAAYIAEAYRLTQKKAAEMESQILDHMKKEGISWEYHIEEGGHVEVLKKYSCRADVAIASLGSSDLDDTEIPLEVTDHLTLDSGCPVLLLPSGAKPALPPQKVVIAYKETKESFRAVRESLSLLKQASEVVVATFGDTHKQEAEGVLKFLERHDVAATHAHNHGDQSNPSRGILALADSVGADVIIMGAYGHSRLREYVFGGVTRHILANSKHCVFMSH